MPGDALVMIGGLDVDLVIADPPYDFDRWAELLAATSANYVVAESGQALDQLDTPGWSVIRSKRYGRTTVTFFERISPDAD